MALHGQVAWETDYKAALAKSKHYGKPLMVFSTVGELSGFV